MKGIHNAELTWSGANNEVNNVDVFRDGKPLITTANDGSYTDDTGNKGGSVSYTYEVCEEGTDTCSNIAVVNF